MGRTRGPAQGRHRRGGVVVWWSGPRRDRSDRPPIVVAVAGLWGDRRLGARARLHFAGVHADQMVPRPARHGDRNGHHGLRRRRHDRRTARQYPSEFFQDADRRRRLAVLSGDGRDLFLLHDDRCLPLSAAARRLAARRLDAASGHEHHDLAAQCASQGCAQDAAILADLVGAVFERLGRHRRDWRSSPMLQEIFGGKLIGHPELGFNALSGEQRVLIAGIGAGFAGLLSLFNIGGRFFWSSLSDYIGRKNTYYTFFILGIICYLLMPWSAN